MRGLTVALGALAFAGTAEARPLQLDDLFRLKTYGQAQISPDGKRIVFGETSTKAETDGFDTQTYVMNADGSGKRWLLDGSGVRWSPDGSRIAFSASEGGKRKLFVLDMTRDDAKPVAITDGAQYPGPLAWSPDGTMISFTAPVPAAARPPLAGVPKAPEGAKWAAEPAVYDSLHYRNITGGARGGERHLFVVPAAGGSARQVTSGAWSVGARLSGIDWGRGGDWTADGRALLFDGLTTPDVAETARFSAVQRVELATGKVETVTRSRGFWTSPRMSPDGRRIAYYGHGDDASTWPARQLRVMDADGGNDRVLIGDLPDEIGLMQWSADGKGLWYGINVRGATNLHWVDLSGRVRDVTTGDWQLSIGSISPAGAAAGQVETSDRPDDVARVDLKTGQVTRLTDARASLGEAELAVSERLAVRAPDGTAVDAWLMKPPGFDPSKRYPLVLVIHGGPHSAYGWEFDFRRQDLAARGYLVLYANPRGSTGYGHAFADAIDQDFPGEKDYADLMATVDAAEAKGFVDPARTYVMGCSGGGALTEWVIGRTDRFAAAMSACPVTNWISLAGTSDAVAWGQTRFAKPFWEDPKPWLDHSPLMRVGKVTTPTLLIIGDKDFRTPVGQAEEFYSALKMRGVEARLIVMKGETHQPWSAPSNLFRSQIYIDDWFRAHTRPGRS